MDQYIIDMSVQIGMDMCEVQAFAENYDLSNKEKSRVVSKFAALQIYNAFIVLAMEASI